jgi:6-pyruvoyltetrahydropterin/6-carboxytetrahydropterin synthase
MATVYITRKEHFNAAHKLWVESWTAEQNLERFGKCANPNWHGHNFNLFVTVKGTPDPVTGLIVDLKELSRLIRARVTDKLDHQNLNLDVDFIRGQMPSTENLAVAIWQQLEEEIALRGGTLHCVKLYETENNYAEYYGE